MSAASEPDKKVETEGKPILGVTPGQHVVMSKKLFEEVAEYMSSRPWGEVQKLLHFMNYSADLVDVIKAVDEERAKEDSQSEDNTDDSTKADTSK